MDGNGDAGNFWKFDGFVHLSLNLRICRKQATFDRNIQWDVNIKVMNKYYHSDNKVLLIC